MSLCASSGIYERDFLLYLPEFTARKQEIRHLSDAILKKAISIPSVRSNVRLVEAFVLEINDALLLEESVLDRIMISVTEVVNNAIIHGNKSDAEKHVLLSCMCYDDRIDFFVRDEGDGFHPDDIPDPLAEGNLLKEGGRGVLIIKSMMDTVEFRHGEHGMEVYLSIRRDSSPA
jgi:serine/threonine-protein kinase RsbW